MEIWLLLLIIPHTPGVAGTSDNLALIKTSRLDLLPIPQKHSDHVGMVKGERVYNRSSVFQLQSAPRWERIGTAGCSHHTEPGSAGQRAAAGTLRSLGCPVSRCLSMGGLSTSFGETSHSTEAAF